MWSCPYRWTLCFILFLINYYLIITAFKSVIDNGATVHCLELMVSHLNLAESTLGTVITSFAIKYQVMSHFGEVRIPKIVHQCSGR